MLRLSKVFTLLIGVLTLLSLVVDRAEAATVLHSFQIDSTVSGSAANSYSVSPPDVTPGSGFFFSTAGSGLMSGSAILQMQFTVNAATDIDLNCFAGAGGAAGAAVARLTDLTTSQFLFQCPLSPVLP